MALGVLGAAVPAALRGLPPFPPVAERLLQLLAQEDVSFADAARLLATDAALSSEVLHLANSPLGGRFPTTNILQALGLLGLSRVRALVLTLAMSKFLRGAQAGPLLRRCWRHNLASALICRHFSREFDHDSDEAYMAGLMHDIGRLALLASNPEIYPIISFHTLDTRDEERSLFGMDHCDAGAWLVAHWNLPTALEQVTLRHHDPLSAIDMLTNLVHVSCAVASDIGFSVTDVREAGKEPTLPDAVADHVAASINAVEIEFGL